MNKKLSLALFVPLLIAVVTLIAFYAPTQQYTYTPQKTKVDHLVVAIYNLQAGMDEFERLSGIKPVFGGEHANGWTQNALVNLGNEQYLEILAPQDDNPKAIKDFAQYSSITPINWAVYSKNIHITHDNLRSRGYKVSTISSGSRVKPNKDKLVWKKISVKSDIPQTPILLEWQDMSIHPSKDMDNACLLQSFKMKNAEPASLQKLAEDLGVEINVEYDENSSISMLLDCPKGLVSFSN